MTDAAAALAMMQKIIRNTDVFWEEVLRINYLRLLSKGTNIVDVGANEGFHSNFFLSELKCARLAAFEPIPELCAALRERWRSRPGVVVYNCALGQANGEAEFIVKQGTFGESGLRQKESYSDGRSDNLTRISTEIRRLDDIELDFDPDYIKIDIEGGEIDMLVGASEMIGRTRPIISVEYGKNGYGAFGYSADSLCRFAINHRYAVFDLLGNRFEDVDDFLSCQGYYWDYLLVPEEKIEALGSRFVRIRSEVYPLPIIRRPRTNMKIPAPVATYDPGTTLAFSSRGNGSHYLASGFSAPEGWGTWTDGPLAKLILPLSHPIENAILSARYRVFARQAGPAASCRVKVNGREIGILRAGDQTWGREFEQTLPVPREALGQLPVSIEFVVSDWRSPSQSSQGEHRALGIGLVKLALAEGLPPIGKPRTARPARGKSRNPA